MEFNLIQSLFAWVRILLKSLNCSHIYILRPCSPVHTALWKPETWNRSWLLPNGSLNIIYSQLQMIVNQHVVWCNNNRHITVRAISHLLVATPLPLLLLRQFPRNFFLFLRFLFVICHLSHVTPPPAWVAQVKYAALIVIIAVAN